MNPVIVRYKVKPETAERNIELVKGVYEELRQLAPAGLHYATFVLEDGVSFVHVATHDDAAAPNPLPNIPAFKRFAYAIEERCDELPATSALREIGSYAFWNG